MEKKIAERYKNKQAEEQAKMLQAELDLQKQQNEAQEQMLQNMTMMQKQIASMGEFFKVQIQSNQYERA